VELSAVAIPANRMWNYEFFHQYASEVIRVDERPGQPAGQFWWADDGEQVSAYWYAYQSRWIPIDRFEGDEAPKLAAALFAASRHWDLGVHINKGQAGASADAVARGRQTAMNPAVFRAAVLVILGAAETAVPGLSGHEPDLAKARSARDGVSAAMQILRAATP